MYQRLKSFINWMHDNERYIENSKTVLLWVLIISSLLLTWSLWTYNPAYEELNQQGTVESIKIEPTGTRKLNTVVRPIQLIYHNGGDNYYSLLDTELRDKIYDKLIETAVINPNDLKVIRTNEVKDPSTFLEFVFPTKLSQKIIEDLFDLENNRILFSEIDRVYLFQKNINGVTKNYLRLISYKEDRLVDLDVQLDYEELLSKAQESNYKQSSFNHIVHNTRGEVERVIYLPTNKVDINPPIKFVRKVKPEDFKLALFNDPSFVNREESNDKIYYSDDKQYLSIATDTNEMTYRSIVMDINDHLTDFERIKKSIDFVNSHYGWTDQYLLFDENDNDGNTFRLMVDGIPVLNSLGVIQLRFDKGQVYEYNRSLINLSYEYPRNFITDEMNEKIDPTRWPSLMSGHDVIEILKKKGQLQYAKDIKIGYSMEKYNNNSSFYEFKPHWYYFDGNYWTQINKLGGESNGLEKD